MPVIDWVFAVCAVLGGFLLVVRLVLMFMGGELEGHADVDVPEDVDIGVDADVGVEGLGDADVSFRLLSLHGFMAFLLIFGLIGLALHRESAFAPVTSVGGAVVAGFLALLLVSYMFMLMRRMQSSGTLNLANALGQEGTVYLTIPPHGTGKVRVTVQGRLKVFEAVSDSDEPIKTGTAIRVRKVVSGNILVVEQHKTSGE